MQSLEDPETAAVRWFSPAYHTNQAKWTSTITNRLMQHAIDYTPYEGLEVTGWPVTTVRRGAVVMRDGVVQAEPGTGQFLPRGPYAMVRPRDVLANGFDAAPPAA